MTPKVKLEVCKQNFVFKGGGGGGVRPFILEKQISSLELEGKARTRPDILRVVLGPYVQYCPGEASEKKLGQKPKSVLKGIELSYCRHSICLLKNEHLRKNNFKI